MNGIHIVVVVGADAPVNKVQELRIMDLFVYFTPLFTLTQAYSCFPHVQAKTLTLRLKPQPLGILSSTKVNYVVVMQYVRQHSPDDQSLSAGACNTGLSSSHSSPIPLHCNPGGDLWEDHSCFQQGHPVQRVDSLIDIYIHSTNYRNFAGASPSPTMFDFIEFFY